MSDDELIDGVYKLVMCIATGGSSQVWEVVEQGSTRHLAMKLLKQDSPDFKENKASLKHEADVLKTLDHPLIVKLEKYSSSRDNTYMVMEHFRAPNVKLQLKSNIKSVQVRARKLFESVCQAISHVHSKGWIHRDIKPDNVLMNKAGEIRLVDFSLSSKEVKGFAKMVGGGKLKTIQGTRTYIAPETIRKQAPVFQTDLYSLGIFFFEVLTGRTPFQAPTPEELLKRHLRDEPANPSEFNNNVTPEMDRLVFRLLKKKPSDRHSSIDEVLGELKRIRIFKEDVRETTAEEEEAKSQTMDNLTELRLDSRADAKLKVMLESNPELARQFEEEKRAKEAKKKKAAAKISADAKVTTDREDAKAKAKGKPGTAAPQQQPMMPMPMMMPQPMMMPPQGYMQPGYPQYPPQQYGMPGGMPGMPPGMPPQGMPGMPGYPNPGMPPQPGFGGPMPPGPGMPPPGGMPPGFPPQAMPPAAMPGAPPMPGAMPGASPQPAPPQVVKAPAPVAPSAKPPAAPVPVPTPVPSAAKPAPAPVKPAPPPAKPAPVPLNPEEMEFMTELPDIL